jgi:predicted dehydrogenase
VVAICGRGRERAEALAKEKAISQVYTDYREMLAKGDLDAVVVAVPDDLHYEMTLAALDAGLHVLCEKPLAMTAAQALEMYQRAEAVGVHHMVFCTYRWFPHYRHLKRLVDEGYVGRVYEASLRYTGDYARNTRMRWRYVRGRQHGALGDLGTHMIDMARWLIGEIATVRATLVTSLERTDMEGRPVEAANDVASLLLTFENGASATLQVSGMAHMGEATHQQSVLLHGADGTLEADMVAFFMPSMRAEIRGLPADQTRFAELPTPADLLDGLDPGATVNDQMNQAFLRQQVGGRLFIDAILNDTPVAPSFYDGWQAQVVVDAALRSHVEGRAIAVRG